jgi:hypothetical protein
MLAPLSGFDGQPERNRAGFVQPIERPEGAMCRDECRDVILNSARHDQAAMASRTF